MAQRCTQEELVAGLDAYSGHADAPVEPIAHEIPPHELQARWTA